MNRTDMLGLTLSGNTVRGWLIAIVLMLIIFTVLFFTKSLITRYLSVFAKNTKNDLDDLIAGIVKHTRIWFLLSLSFYLTLPFYRFPGEIRNIVIKLVIILAFLQAALWGNTIISFFAEKKVRADRERDDEVSVATTYALSFIARLCLWTVITLLSLDNLGVDITTLVAGLGIGGVAAALALQNVLGDLFGSLSIMLDKPFVIGDFIVVDNYMGTVEHIGLKSTRIRSLSGEQIVFSNSDLLSSRIRNYKRMSERRVVFYLGVTYETPYEKLVRIPGLLREIIEAQPQVRFDRAHFKEYGDYSLNFEIVYYVLSQDYNLYMDIQQAINMDIFHRFKEEGIEFAYPTQTLYLQNTAQTSTSSCVKEAIPSKE